LGGKLADHALGEEEIGNRPFPRPCPWEWFSRRMFIFSQMTSKRKPIEKYDSLEIRCRLLGHQVPFQYCRSSNRNLPCRKIMDCWWERVEIEPYLRENFTPEELSRSVFAEPKTKIVSLIELIEKAKKKGSSES
jgi:hypothetical protein